MNQFTRRRILGGGILFICSAALWTGDWLVTQRLGHRAWFSGGVLFGCLCVLMLIGLRRRLPMLPLLRMSTWVQVHIYTGVFACLAFCLHLPRWSVDGIFEGMLAALFLSVAVSGFYGLYISRTAPGRLTAVPGDFRYEQLAWHRRKIADLADGILEELQATPAAAVLARFYCEDLQPFFASRPSLAYVALPTGGRRRRLLSGLGSVDRYLEPESKRTAGRLAALVRMRDDLDYHFALHLRLRLWVAVHAMLSCGLLVAAVAHVLLVIQFAGD